MATPTAHEGEGGPLRFVRYRDRAKHMTDALASARANDGYVDIPPFQIDIEPTKRCNLACRFCSRNYWNRDRNLPVHLREGLLERVEPLYKYCACSALQGLGEPLLYPGIFDLVRFARSLGVAPSLNSNATLFTEQNCRSIVESGIESITLSIDGIKTFPQLRGIRAEKVVENVKRLILEKERQGSSKPALGIEVVLSLINMGDLVDLVKLAHELGIGQVVVYHPEIYDYSLLVHSFYNDLEQTRRTFARARRAAAKYGIRLMLPDLDITRPSSHSSGEISVNRTYCDFPFQYLMVNAVGNVSTCCIGCIDEADSNIQVGNVFDEDIVKLWNNGKIRALRRQMLTMRPEGLCARCPMKGYSAESYMRLFDLAGGGNGPQ